MAADAQLKRIYVNTGDIPPPSPPGFTLDPSAPPALPPPPGFVPDPVGKPYVAPQPSGDAEVPPAPDMPPPPPPGYVVDIGGALPEATVDASKTLPGRMVEGLLSLPRRAIENSQQSLGTGTYDPSTSVEAAMLTMGTGGVAGVPVKGGEAVLGAGPVRKVPAATTPPPPQGYVLDGTADALANDLHTIRQSSVADRAEMENTIKALPAEVQKNAPLNEKLYHAAEDPAELAKLTPNERQIFDQHLEPMRQEQFDLAFEAKKLGGDKLIDDPNYMHKMAVGHTPQYDSVTGSSYDPVTGTRGLPRTTSALQERKFYALESPKGTRAVITPNNNGITVWRNHTGTNVPTSADIKPGEIVHINGVDWTVKSARTKEIEQHGLFKGKNGPVPAEYHKSAFANTADAIVHLREVVRNLKLLKDIKGSQWWLNHAQKVGGNKMAPEGWVRPKMPALNDWYVEPKLAAVLDDFYKPGLLGDIPEARVLREINQFATSSIFWNPIGHAANVGVHWSVARGWDWLRPGPMRHFATDMTRAIKAVVTQNKDYQRFLREGGGLVYGGVKNADFYRSIGKQMGMDIQKNWGAWKPLFDKLGLGASPAKAVAWWYGQMRNILWQSSDIFMIHRYLELERKGYSTARAIREAEKHIPNYRIPAYIGSKVLGQRMGRMTSMVMQEPALTNFARYHYGMWKSFMNMATDLAKGTKAEKKEALGNVAVLAFMGYFVYPTLDWIYQKMTGDPNAKLTRRGAMSVPHGLAEVSRNRMSFAQFLQQNLTPAPATKEIFQTIFPNDFFTARPLPYGVPRVEHAAEAMVSPYATAAQAYRGGEGARSPSRQLLDSIIGGENTSEKTEKGKLYGAMLRDKEALRHEEKPQGPIEGAYYGAKRVIGMGTPPKEPKKKFKDGPLGPKNEHRYDSPDSVAPKRSHHKKGFY